MAVPIPACRDSIIDMAFHRGLLLLPCGPSTVRFCPPLCLTKRQVEIGLDRVEAAMTAVVEQAGETTTTEAGRELEEITPDST